MNKTCYGCFSTKDVAEFTKKASSPDGLSSRCKTCQAARRAKRRVQVRPRVSTAAPVAGSDFIQSKELVATWAAALGIAQKTGRAPNLLFTGPSGSGKTESARDLAERAGLPFFKVDASAQTDPEAWFGTREVAVRDGASVTVYNPSAFVDAMSQPCVLLIDEVNRVADAIRGILLPLLDDSRAVTNPLTGQPLVRHPECFIIMTANVGLAFTGTYAVDPAFLTRALTTTFAYLDAPSETALAIARTGVSEEIAALFVRFANETRSRARQTEDFPPVSTREVLVASGLAEQGLDPTHAIRQTTINAASAEGGAESIHAQLEMIWTGIRPSQK